MDELREHAGRGLARTAIVSDHDANAIGNDGLAGDGVDDVPPHDRRGFQRDKHFRFGIERQRLILERGIPFGAVDCERAIFRKRVDFKSPVGAGADIAPGQFAVLAVVVEDAHAGREATGPQGDASADAVTRLEGHLQAGGFARRTGVKAKLAGREALRRHAQLVTPEDVVDIVELGTRRDRRFCRTSSKSCSCPGSPAWRWQRACHRAP